MSEVVQNGVNGILLPEESAIERCLAALRLFVEDREKLLKVSEMAVFAASDMGWAKGCRELANHLISPSSDT